MSLEKTEAVILTTHNWSESSRTVELFTRDFGKLSLVDKGGRRFKTKRGRLIPFARLEVTFYKSEKSASGYLSEVALLEPYPLEKDGSIGRLGYASAACELLRFLLSDEQPQPGLYRLFVRFLSLVESTEKRFLPGLFLTFFLRLLSHLGYHPSLAHCVNCGRPAVSEEEESPEQFFFSPERGGILCPSCQTAGDYYIPLSDMTIKQLVALQNASLAEAGRYPIGYTEATILVEALVKFVNFQTGLISRLKSLEFLKQLKPTNNKGNETE